MTRHVSVIAEAGVNHNGDLDTAKKLIDAAGAAGADYVKFQTFKADKLVSESAFKASYQIQNMNDGERTQHAMLKRLELPEEWHYALKEHAEKRGVIFLSTGFDEDSIDFLDHLGIPFFKIPSGEITNKPYLQHVAAKGKPVILSTGMADLQEIKSAVDVIMSSGLSKDMITILHCNTEYPTPMEDVNLLAMKTIEQELQVKVGYSDHTLGIEVPIAAVALGAVVIEKHFTLDRNMQGPDHRASLEPEELKAMVLAIRNIELALSGDGIKKPSPSEINNILSIRKSIHYSKDLKASHTLSLDDLMIIRPAGGWNPMCDEELIGKILTMDVESGTPVIPKNFE